MLWTTVRFLLAALVAFVAVVALAAAVAIGTVVRGLRRRRSGGAAPGARPGRRASLLAALACACLMNAGCADSGNVSPPKTEGEVLTRQEPAPADRCPESGTALYAGVDEDGDGVLSEDEIQVREYVCAESAPALLTRFEEQAASESCPEGGHAVHSGLDTDGDAILDDGEILSTEIVCAGVVLTRVVAEPAGVHCAAGGMAVQSGIDRDRDGALDDAEVAATEYRCGNVLDGDVVIRSADDLALLDQVVIIHGSVSVDSSAPAVLELPALQWIRGNLVIQGNATLERLSLPALAWIDGSLELEGTHALVALETPVLERVDGMLRVVDNAALTNLHVPGIGGGILVADNTALRWATLYGAGLSSLEIRSNPVLDTLSLSGSFRSFGYGNVRIHQNLALATLHLDLDVVGGDTTIQDNPALADLWLHGMYENIAIVNNDALRSVSAPDEKRIGGSLHVRDNAALEAISVFDSPAIDGDVVISNNPNARSIRLCAETIAGSVRILDSAAHYVSGCLTTNTRPRIGASLEIRGTMMEYFDNRGAFDLTDTHVVIEANPVLGWIDTTSYPGGDWDARTRNGSLTILGNPMLGSVTYPLDIDGSFRVEDNDSLRSLPLYFGPLAEIAGDVIIRGNDALESAGIRARVIEGSVIVADNPALTQLHFPQITSVRQLSIGNNVALTTLDLTGLTYASRVGIYGNDSLLDTTGLASLRQVGNSVSFHGNATMTGIALPALERTGALTVEEHPALAAFDMPLLAQVTSGYIRNNPVLPTCAANALLDQAHATWRTVEGNDDAATCP